MTKRPKCPEVDLTGEAPVLPDVASLLEAASVPGLAPLTYRAPLLVACRESNEYDAVLMQGLVEQTLAFDPSRPSVEIARQLGIRPLLEGSASGVAVANLTVGKAKAVLFEIEGDFFLYAMTSAAKSNENGDNDWTKLTAGVLQSLRPHVLQVASLSRLVRAFDHSALLLHAVTQNVDEVRAGATSMKMRGEGSETGQLLWSLLAMVAASERTLIVQRLTAGTVAKYRRGEWIKGAGAVPLGYLLDPETLRLAPDPKQAEALRLAFTWMADPQVTKFEVVRRLGDLGVSTRRVRDWHGPEATVADLKAPEMYIKQLLKWADLYLTGTHVTRWPNPFEGARHIAGMPVLHIDGKEVLEFAYDFGRPDVDPSLIQAALAAQGDRASAAPKGGASHKRAPAFGRTSWVQDDMWFWLEPSKDSTYEIRVRPMAGGME